VFDLHTAARLISDLNNICFVIDVQIMNTVATGMAQDIEFRPYDLLVNPACFEYHHRHASAELSVCLIYCIQQTEQPGSVVLQCCQHGFVMETASFCGKKTCGVSSSPGKFALAGLACELHA
jgi:hypothetical protein